MLIHMNGRGYDYQLGRFLSVDPFIQAPANSQSHNPYSYIMNNPLAGTDPSGYLWCGTGALEKAECNDEQKHKRRDSGSVGFRAAETIWINGGPASSNGARHSPRSAATGERERGEIGGPGESASISRIEVTGSTESSKLTNSSIPSGNVLGTKETDKKATEILDGFGSDTKEQAMVVMRDGTSVSPSSCTTMGCTFEVDPKKVLFAAHTHVESDHQHSGIAMLITQKREMPGPGDHAFPVLSGAPNYILTPKGAIRVLEFENGAYQVRTLRGAEVSSHWSPADATPSESEIKRALRR